MKCKNILSMLIAVTIIFGIMTITPFTVSAATSGDFEYNVLDDGTAEITRYSGTAKEVTIPEKIDGYVVTSIADHVFMKNNSVNKIIISEFINKIDTDAFTASITIKEINVVSNNKYYQSIDGILFNKSKDTLVRCPMGKSLDTYTIPDGVVKIEDYAFFNCVYVRQLTISASVNQIGFIAFKSSGIENFYVNSKNNYFTSYDGVIYNKNKSVLLDYPSKSTTENFVCPASVSKIGDYAFFSTDGLNNVEFNNNITEIGKFAFAYCSDLEKIVIPYSVNSIGTYAFYCCENLAQVSIPNTISNIGGNILKGTAWINNYQDDYVTVGNNVLILYKGTDKNITIPNNVKYIAMNTFDDCTFLESVVLQNGITGIGESVFLYCEKLTEITIPKTVDDIGFVSVGFYIDSNTHYVKPKTDFTIKGYKNTAAETYANENGFTFIALDEAEYITGDFDGDGMIGISDATEVQRYLAAQVECTDAQLQAGDVNGDGFVTVDDATAIQRYVAGIITEFGK